MKYTPNPMQTNDITLSDDLVALTELIAANVHDVWAAGRIKEGWTYGEVKDTEKKTTPWKSLRALLIHKGTKHIEND